MHRLVRLSMLIALALACGFGAALAQDMTPEEQQAMMKAMTPGDHHQHLKRFAGKFEYTSKMWMAPDAPAMESKGTSESTIIMGGRYLKDVVSGNAMGMPFEGLGVMGYDNVSEQYTFAWIDNMSTAILRASGTCSNDGKVLTLEGSMPYPGMPEPIPFKEVITYVDDKHHTMEWFMPSEEDGKMFKTMELSYTRVE